MAYDQQCETLRFVRRNNSFRFRCFSPRRRPKRNGRRPRACCVRMESSSRGALARRGDPENMGALRSPGLLRFARNDDRGSTQMQLALVRRDRGDPGQVTQATSIDLALSAAKRASKGAEKVRPVNGIVQLEGQLGSLEVARNST
jgi:hypothetical protein